MKNIDNKLATSSNNNNYIDLMVGIVLMTLMTAWAAAITMGFGFYYSGRYVEEWLLIAIWFHLGCFIVRGLEIVFDGVGCAIRGKHKMKKESGNRNTYIYHLGEEVYLEKVQGEPEHNGLRGKVTGTKNGLLYGTWGDFGVDPSVDRVVTINN